MTRRRALAGAAALLALAAFAAGMLLSRPPARQEAPPPPAEAAEAAGRLLALPLLDPSGKEATLGRWRGKPLVVNFWATWCPPCLAEMPVLSRLQKSHPEVQLVGIAIDTPENVQRFAAANAPSYPLFLGSEGALSLMADLGNGRGGLPFTVALDAAGRVKRVRLGALSEAEAEGLLLSLK